MPRKAITMALSLPEETRSTLSALARSRTAPAHHIERSAIILHLADRRDASEIAANLGIDRQRVTRCVRRVQPWDRSRPLTTCPAPDGRRISPKRHGPG
jgi:hypothetical protein